MARIGAPWRLQADAWENMCDGKLNGGITYSNYKRRESVLVTELTSNEGEFLDSLVHETGHLATHIALADGIDLEGEEVRYIHGDITRALFPYCRKLICGGCYGKRGFA